MLGVWWFEAWLVRLEFGAKGGLMVYFKGTCGMVWELSLGPRGIAPKWSKNERFFWGLVQMRPGSWFAMGSGNFARFCIKFKGGSRFKALGWGLMVEEGLILCIGDEHMVWKCWRLMNMRQGWGLWELGVIYGLSWILQSKCINGWELGFVIN